MGPGRAYDVGDAGGAASRAGVGHCSRTRSASGSWGAWEFSHQDAVGSTVAVSDAAGAVVGTRNYGVFGDTWAEEGTILGGQERFASGTRDAETGLWFLKARYLDAGSGMFLSRDPVPVPVGQPHESPYTYVWGRPTAMVDPTGMLPEEPTPGWVTVAEVAGMVISVIPCGVCQIVGAVLSAVTVGYYASKGDAWGAAFAGLGALPLVAAGVRGLSRIGRAGGRALGMSDDVARIAAMADDAGWAGAAARADDVDLPVLASWDDIVVADDVVAVGNDVGRVARPRRCNSFLGETPVLMADGSRKRIDEVEVGDWVVASDPVTGRTAAREVAGVIVGEGGKDLVDVTIGAGGGAAVVVATAGHPFWVDDEGRWVDAGELEVGDRVLTPDGDTVPVTAVRGYRASARVHNLTVAGIHTFYVGVGHDDVLVHNTDPRKCGVVPAGALDDAATNTATASPSSFTRTEALSGRASARKVSELAESMRTGGWQGDPIKVIEHNGQRIVVDGHHRIAAARAVGIDVPYEVVDPSSVIGPGQWSSLDDILNDSYSVGADRIRAR